MSDTSKLAGTVKEAVEQGAEEVISEETPLEETEEAEETEITAEELSEAEEKDAKALFKLLKDPKMNRSVLRIMAEQAGILSEDKPPETQREEAKVRKDIKTRLEERLGKDFSFLNDKLGPLLDEVIAEVKEDHEEKFQNIEAQRVQNEVVGLTEKLNRETKGEFKKLESRMSELADEILPGPNVTTEQYMRRLYALASSERKVDPKGLQQKIERNRTDVGSRLQGTHGKGDGFDPNKKYSLKESVRMAAETIEKGSKK